ncbi:MAG: hypothetical protein KatS3mg029_0367 [Saprospiraceae bacterium]|nr:MAG: hypothetical protein KatS3mg029_0367 [Saprospiraceae bacterium]
MKKKITVKDFRKQRISEHEARGARGGRNYIPSTSGSYGFINWDDVDIRTQGFTPHPTASYSQFTGKLRFGN